MRINDLITQKRWSDLYILCRYFYRIGEPIADDAAFEYLQKGLMEKQPPELKEYFERTYDDDPVPSDLLAELGVNPVYAVPVEGRSELYNYLNEDKSYSIESVTEYEQAWPFFKGLVENQLDFVVSVKVDGVNTKMLYLNDELALSLSRGRHGNSFDYTDNTAKVMPQKIEGGPEVLRVTGESFVCDEGLPILRQKYKKPDGYVSGKSSAISMLRVAHDREDYRFLNTLVFYAEGLADTLTGTFEKLDAAGVKTVPYKKFSWSEIPGDYDEFCAWLKSEVFDYMKIASIGIPSDGVVVEVDDLHWTGVEHNQYVSRQLALKFEYWSFAYYEGIIRSIRIEQRRVNKSVRVEIEPIRTRDGNNAEVINCFNPSIIIQNELYEGKKVYFERNSDAVNILLYGSRLDKAIGGSI